MIAAIANHLELRLCESSTGAAGPTREAEVKLTVGQQVATYIERLAINLDSIAGSKCVVGKIFLTIQVYHMQTIGRTIVALGYIIGIIGSRLLLGNGLKGHP